MGDLMAYTFAAAGRKIGLSRSRISRLARAGDIATVRIDGRDYVRGDSLEVWARNAVARKLGMETEEVRINV